LHLDLLYTLVWYFNTWVRLLTCPKILVPFLQVFINLYLVSFEMNGFALSCILLLSFSWLIFSYVADPVFWPVFVIATLAAIVGSQAIITATFSIVKQCQALCCFPRVKVVHTSKHMYGQVYIPEINWILMILTLSITLGFRETSLIGNAYGLACMAVMFVTTFLMALVIIFVWQKSILLAALFLLFFWFIEGAYLLAAFIKVPQGGWVPLVLSIIFMMVMYTWHYDSQEVQF
jgi:KUP system potassium uptake protein